MSQQALGRGPQEGGLHAGRVQQGCCRAWLSCWAHAQGQQGRRSSMPPWHP